MEEVTLLLLSCLLSLQGLLSWRMVHPHLSSGFHKVTTHTMADLKHLQQIEDVVQGFMCIIAVEDVSRKVQSDFIAL